MEINTLIIWVIECVALGLRVRSNIKKNDQQCVYNVVSNKLLYRGTATGSVFFFQHQHQNLINFFSNLFPLIIPLNFAAKWRRRGVFGNRWRHHRSRCDSRLFLCLVNTVNGRVARLECRHVWAGRGEDGLWGWHRRWAGGRRWAHTLMPNSHDTLLLVLLIDYSLDSRARSH